MSTEMTVLAKAIAAMGRGEIFEFHEIMFKEVWDKAIGPEMNWLWSVIAGEFADNRPLDAIITDAVAGFLPGVSIVQGVRDASAITLRLTAHPERRDDWKEWAMLCVNLIVVFLPVATAGAAAAGGATIAGVGALAGAVGGTLAGEIAAAFLKIVMLVLLRGGVKMVNLVRTVSKFVKGNVAKLLKKVEFEKLAGPLKEAVVWLVGKITSALKTVKGLLEQLLVKIKESNIGQFVAYISPQMKAAMKAGVQPLKDLIAKLSAWEKQFYDFQRVAMKQMPQALASLQARLAEVLLDTMPLDSHLVTAGAKADVVKPPVIKPQQISSPAAQPLKLHEQQMLSQMHGNTGASSGGAGKKVMPPTPVKAPVPMKTPKAVVTPVPVKVHDPIVTPAPVKTTDPLTAPPVKAHDPATTHDPAAKLDPDVDLPVTPHDPNATDPAALNVKSKAGGDALALAEREEITNLAKAGKIEDARNILRPYVDEARNAKTPLQKEEALEKIIARLDVSSSKPKMFWSGDKQLAGEFAKNNGATILEQTPGASVIDNWKEINDVFSWNKSDMGPWGWDLWGEVSENYAKGASGIVDVIQTPFKFPKGGPTWLGREWPTIYAEGNVSSINIFSVAPDGQVLDSLSLDVLSDEAINLFGGIK